jgi:hypothetical protein
MNPFRIARIVAAWASLLAAASGAIAQVPSHPPGTICFTQTFWCWANPPGPAGTRCTCPSPYGPIPGVLG